MSKARPGRFFFALASALLFLFFGGALAWPQSAIPEATAASVRLTRVDTRKAKKAYERGLRAEQAEDWPVAFAAYGEALGYDPSNTEFRLRHEAARFRLMQQHTDRAEREALAGRMQQARDELRAALRLDPGYSVAQERLAQFQTSLPQAPLQAPSSPEGTIQLRPQPGTHDFDLRGSNTRTAYEEVARRFGLRVTFDSDLSARPVRLRVNGVDFDTAMSLLSQQTGTFWRALDARTFFVADNTPQKRREYAPVVVQTFVLPASTTPDKMTETLRLVREIAGVAHTELDTRTHTITLRDSPGVVAMADALIQEIEQAHGEMMLEITLLEVDRTEARRLGITPPDTARIITFSQQDIQQAQQSLQGLQQVITRLFGTGTVVPPVVAFGGGRTVFLATLPGAAADFSQTLNLVRSGRRMLLRAQDSQSATFFIGERFPITLALLGNGLVPATVIPGVSQSSFPRTDFATGRMPTAITLGDFNGDGRLDLAIANQQDNSVSILLGNGDGTFRAKIDTPTGGVGPVGIAAGDFNGDGRLDLAVVNRGSNNVSVLLGNGDGTFTPAAGSPVPVGAEPTAVVAVDFNGDKRLDLAVANQGSNNLSILLGNGNGTFTPATGSPVAAGNSPVALIAGDFNGDGRSDLAVANQTSNTVTLLLGNGDGTFTPAAGPPPATGSAPVAIVTGDFNGDGKLDLATANQTDNSVSLLLGNGDGTFQPRADFATGSKPVALAAADFNLDSRLDLIVANQNSNSVSLLLGLGNGQFGSKADLAVGNGPSAIAAGSLKGDGRPDVAVTNQTDNTVSVILNTVAFLPATPTGSPQVAFPGSEYVDLGLKVRATPRIHLDDEVTLQLQFEIRSLSGEAFNGIPVITNRNIEQTVRLRENETTLLSGIIQREETRTITGLPGFARVGHAAGRRDTQTRDTELLILITPRQVRLAPHKDRSIYAGRGSGTGGERPQVLQ